MVPEGGERKIYSDPYPAGGAPVCDGVHGEDANANKDGSGAIVGSVGGDGGCDLG